jgi:hypothetical protein
MGVGIIMPVTRGRLLVQLIGDNLTGAAHRPETAIILT